jgi:hypothetical protein
MERSCSREDTEWLIVGRASMPGIRSGSPHTTTAFVAYRTYNAVLHRVEKYCGGRRYLQTTNRF